MTGSLYISTLPWVESFEKSCVSLSKSFKDKRQRNNFKTFLVSIALTGNAVLLKANLVTSKDKHWSHALSHFFNRSVWEESHIEKQRRNTALKNILKDCKVVAVDSSALVKTGKNFEYECRVYDSRDKRIHDGFPILIATGVTKNNHYTPLIWKRYSHIKPDTLFENPVKEAFIKEIADLFKYRLNKPIVVADSGFCRENIVHSCQENELPFIVRTAKRKVRLSSGEVRLTTELKAGLYENILVCVWKNFYCNLIVGGWDEERKARLVILTNLPVDDYSQTQFCKLYGRRWFVEESIKQLKQHFGLEDFRVRRWRAVERFLTLSFLAATLLHISLKKHNAWIQHFLPSLLKGCFENFSACSINYCRQLLQKLLFCGLDSLKPALHLAKQLNSP